MVVAFNTPTEVRAERNRRQLGKAFTAGSRDGRKLYEGKLSKGGRLKIA
jgi:hypothetical protein